MRFSSFSSIFAIVCFLPRFDFDEGSDSESEDGIAGAIISLSCVGAAALGSSFFSSSTGDKTLVFLRILALEAAS